HRTRVQVRPKTVTWGRCPEDWFCATLAGRDVLALLPSAFHSSPCDGCSTPFDGYNSRICSGRQSNKTASRRVRRSSMNHTPGIDRDDAGDHTEQLHPCSLRGHPRRKHRFLLCADTLAGDRPTERDVSEWDRDAGSKYPSAHPSRHSAPVC